MQPARPTDLEPATARTLSSSAPDDLGLLKAFLVDRDWACGRCGYNLRGNTTAACPECAEPIALTTATRSAPGLGHGAFVIWLVPGVLSLFLWGEFSAFLDIAFIINTAALAAMGLMLLTALILMTRPVSARAVRAYWWISRLLLLLYALGLVLLFLTL